MFIQEIADFRSGKAEPCPGIADLWLDQSQAEFFCGDMQATSAVTLQSGT